MSVKYASTTKHPNKAKALFVLFTLYLNFDYVKKAGRKPVFFTSLRRTLNRLNNITNCPFELATPLIAIVFDLGTDCRHLAIYLTIYQKDFYMQICLAL